MECLSQTLKRLFDRSSILAECRFFLLINVVSQFCDQVNQVDKDVFADLFYVLLHVTFDGNQNPVSFRVYSDSSQIGKPESLKIVLITFKLCKGWTIKTI